MPSGGTVGGGGGGGGAVSAVARARGRAAGRDTFVLTWYFPGHANRRENVHKAVCRYDAAGGVNVNTTSANPVALATTLFRDADFFDPIGSSSAIVQVTQTGRYRATYACNVENSGASAGSIKTYLRKNGTTEVPGSQDGSPATTAQPRQGCGGSVLLDLTAGDYLEVIAIRNGGPGACTTYANGSMLTLELVSYPDESLLGGRQIVPRAGALRDVRISKGVSGWSGTTYVRMLKNGVSMMGSNDIPILATENYVEVGDQYHSVYHVHPGDLVTIDVQGEEAPYARDLVVQATFAAIT